MHSRIELCRIEPKFLNELLNIFLRLQIFSDGFYKRGHNLGRSHHLYFGQSRHYIAGQVYNKMIMTPYLTQNADAKSGGLQYCEMNCLEPGITANNHTYPPLLYQQKI